MRRPAFGWVDAMLSAVEVVVFSVIVLFMVTILVMVVAAIV